MQARKHRLLIVEDSKPIASLIQYVAKEAGYETQIATTMAKCVEYLRTHETFDLASVDYNLPDAPDGEAIDAVLAHRVAAVVMTGKLDAQTRERVLNKAVVDYIPKESAEAFNYLGKLLTRFAVNPKIKILIVDDATAFRSYLVHLLERHRYQVLEAENGAQGLQILEQNPDISLVITDHEMPVMSGIRFVSEIRKKYPKERLCVIGLSSTETQSLASRFIQNGANDFLIKPFCLEEFYCRIAQSLEHLEYMVRLKRLADIDSLTALYNRYAFFKETEALALRCVEKQQAYAVAMIDIDLFKKVNDNYGHDMGDAVIVDLAQQLTQHFSANDFICARFGGEEFVIFIKPDALSKIEDALAQFRIQIADRVVQIAEQRCQYTISGGLVVACWDLDKMIQLADEALYRSKENGRNKITIDRMGVIDGGQ
ncbi:diguanylate cyclase [Catenovulum sediminis]|uniref:diguanylate cyclase n=1 Tax=Catenovulum sediminis TaxID=1740262 RepID=A0ABV1RHQ0_9ALTE